MQERDLQMCIRDRLKLKGTYYQLYTGALELD